MTVAPRLVTVAHGTRVSAGNLVATAITARAARRLGRQRAVAAYVELAAPLLADVMAVNEVPSVVVPLLLSTGYHVKHDIPWAVGSSPARTVMARPLGPHPLLAEVMCQRLLGAGARPGDPVVIAAAGSNDPDAAEDLADASRLLQARWGAPVRVATVSGQGRPIPEVVEEARADGRVALAPYLLSPGFFARRARSLGEGAGAYVVADVLGCHPLIVELVVRRYRGALAAYSSAA
jgi:sirohydrochlorin ferrochelatase